MNQHSSQTPTGVCGPDFRHALPRLHQKAIEHRRHLHQYPELSGAEHHTTGYIEDQLRSLGVRIVDFPGPGVVAQIDAPEAGSPLIALRADIDALPVTEDRAHPVVSNYPGIAHACGHDGHTGILLAVAQWLAESSSRLSTSVRMIFQSSEEQIPSGAERLVDLGALNGVERIFGLHLWQNLPKAEIGVIAGPMMASTDDFDLVLTGPGGHGGTPHQSVDVIVTAARLVTDLQAVVARQQHPLHPLVITVGHFESRGHYNVMPAQAHLQGTVRALDPTTRDNAQRWVTQTAEAAAAQSGAKVELTYQRGTPPLINDSVSAGLAEVAARQHCHQAQVVPTSPVMGGEDFSFYLQQTPGAFVFIGMGGPSSRHAHHTPKFDIDEDTLSTGIELMVGIVDDYRAQRP